MNYAGRRTYPILPACHNLPHAFAYIMRLIRSLITITALAIAGCGDSGPRAHAVTGAGPRT